MTRIGYLWSVRKPKNYENSRFEVPAISLQAEVQTELDQARNATGTFPGCPK
jgi:hypothetical protein